MRISEDFYSVQGEGYTTGIPSYFIRMQGCNLMCGGVDGSLMKEGKATWWCDTEYVWKKGNEVSNEELLDRFQKANQLENILDGRTHLIWTGGEPTLLKSRESIRGFLNYINERYEGNNIFNEIETNGTILVENDFYGKYIQQINCSPKLLNSGMEWHKRLIPQSLKQINNYRNSWFKFVVSKEDDIKEIYATIIYPIDIPREKIILMPGVDRLEDLSERTRFVYEMGKKYCLRTCTRGQVLAWNKTTGV